MNGMRTKGAEFSTDFGTLKASKDMELPLARVQNSLFDTPASKKKATEESHWVVVQLDSESSLDNAPALAIPFKTSVEAEEKINELENASDVTVFSVDYYGSGSENDVRKYFSNNDVIVGNPDMTVENVYHALTDWSKNKEASKKKAVYFDGYAYRVTIESKAGNNNQTYSFITNLLSAADIRYREVRRYTIEPDRVMMDILIKKEDVDVIKELDKEGKKYDVSFTFDDNISEGVQPKTIVTPEKEVPEKVSASKNVTSAISDRDELLKALQEKFPKGKFRPSEEFDPKYQSGVWTGSGSMLDVVIPAIGDYSEDTVTLPLFDYYAEDSEIYHDGIYYELADFLAANNTFAEPYDPGTYFIYPNNK